MTEKFALKWNDFQSNWSSSLSELRKDTDLADVTLISEDKVKFTAHKILLSSCSSMFKFILKENIQAHPLVYLGGVSSINIGFILDYIYYGEVNIHQEHLDSFLESAQKLEITGLIDSNQGSKKKEKGSFGQGKTNATEILTKEEWVDNPSIYDNTFSGLATNHAFKERRLHTRRAMLNDAPRINVENMTPEEIEAQTKELYQKVDGVWTCLQCGKTSNVHCNMKFHVETHMDGLCYPCNICSKEFRSKNTLNFHKSTTHK